MRGQFGDVAPSGERPDPIGKVVDTMLNSVFFP